MSFFFYKNIFIFLFIHFLQIQFIFHFIISQWNYQQIRRQRRFPQTMKTLRINQIFSFTMKHELLSTGMNCLMAQEQTWLTRQTCAIYTQVCSLALTQIAFNIGIAIRLSQVDVNANVLSVYINVIASNLVLHPQALIRLTTI